jgi:hypothetical protein
MPNRFAQLLEKLQSNILLVQISLTLYYLAILVALILMYGPGNFSSPAFIYQGF